jgi:DNA replication protein DnaC
MEELIGKMTEAISASVPHPENEYIDEEGMARCSVCHERVEYIARVPALNIERKVRCICSCIQKERDSYKEVERQQDMRRRRMKCFAESSMEEWTFANDDMSNAGITAAMKNYVKHFEKFKAEGRGLLLYGSVGTGKTYHAACIANALIDEGYTVKMTNFARIANELFSVDDKNEYIDSLNRCSLLILDDLGAERNTEYMQEQVFNVIDARYRSGLPFIVTTNLSGDELKKTSDITSTRIYDRVMERCHPVKVEGVSRRRNKLKESYSDTSKLLGL